MIIEVKNLVKKYSEKTAVDHLDLQIKEGIIYGLLGPNGAGKSTTINCMLGLLKSNEGSIKILGEEMNSNNLKLKSNIGVIPQNVSVFEELTVYENIDFFCGLYIKDKDERKRLVEEAIEFVGLSEYKKYTPKKLSGGLVRRLNIACGIAHKPKIIFMDEPTVAVDPQSRNSILEGVLKLKEQGSTIIYTSHYMEEVEQICDEVAIIDSGKVIAKGTTEELKNMITDTEKLVIHTYGVENKVIEEIKNIADIKSVEKDNNTIKISYKKNQNSTLLKILQVIEDNGVNIDKIYNEVPTLNTVFLELTGKQLRDNM